MPRAQGFRGFDPGGSVSAVTAARQLVCQKIPATGIGLHCFRLPVRCRTLENMPLPDPTAIEKLAHELWIGRGRPEGSPETDWLRAEQILRAPTVQEKSRSGPRTARKVPRVIPDDSCDA
jgi:hypothetical protein